MLIEREEEVMPTLIMLIEREEEVMPTLIYIMSPITFQEQIIG